MGRRPAPITDTGPVGRFATELAELKATVHDATFRSMAKSCTYSHSVLADAVRGLKLPTWEVVRGFVTALGVPQEEVEDWQRRWTQAHEELNSQHRRVGADRGTPGTGPAGAGRGRLRPVTPDLVEQVATVPRPQKVRTHADLLYELRVLRIQAGEPSLKEIRTMMRGRPIAKSTLSDIFTGRRIPRRETFLDLVGALLTAAGPDRDDGAWRDAASASAQPWSGGYTAKARMLSGLAEDWEGQQEHDFNTPDDAVVGFSQLYAMVQMLASTGLWGGDLDRAFAAGRGPDLRQVVRLGTALGTALEAGTKVLVQKVVLAARRRYPGVIFADDVFLRKRLPVNVTVGFFSNAGLSESLMKRLKHERGDVFAVTIRSAVSGPASWLRTCVVFASVRTGQPLFAVDPDWRPPAASPAGGGRGGQRGGERVASWRRLTAWQEAWAAAEYNKQRPDLTRATRYGAVVLLQSAGETGPAPGILAKMPAEQVAALLGAMPEAEAAILLRELPGDFAQAVIRAMLQLHHAAPAPGHDGARPVRIDAGEPGSGSLPTG